MKINATSSIDARRVVSARLEVNKRRTAGAASQYAAASIFCLVARPTARRRLPSNNEVAVGQRNVASSPHAHLIAPLPSRLVLRCRGRKDASASSKVAMDANERRCSRGRGGGGECARQSLHRRRRSAASTTRARLHVVDSGCGHRRHSRVAFCATRSSHPPARTFAFCHRPIRDSWRSLLLLHRASA